MTESSVHMQSSFKRRDKKYTYKSDVQCETACDTYAQTNDKKKHFFGITKIDLIRLINSQVWRHTGYASRTSVVHLPLSLYGL